jgi:hypothetical protein
MDLTRTCIRILPVGVQILTRPALTIEADNHLLARLLLRGDVLGREVIETVLTTPGERGEESLGGVGDDPACGA